MADDEMTTIATNLVPDPRLTQMLPVSQNANQQVRSTGMGLILSLTDPAQDGWVAPWNSVAPPEGGSIGVLLIQTVDGLSPVKGASLTGEGVNLVWLRGGVSSYAHAIAIRSTDLSNVRLHLPENGKQLTLLKVGLFDTESWANMQSRSIIYFDGGGITQAGMDSYTLPPATTRTLGGVIVGDGLTVDDTGLLSVLKQEIPVATQDTVGGIKPGLGLQTSADGTTSVKVASNSHIQFNADGELETYGLDVDFSDYYTKTQTDAKFLTKSDAELTYQKKDSSGSGGNNTGGNSGLSANYQFMQVRFTVPTEQDTDITTNANAQTVIPLGTNTVTIGPGSFISGISNGLTVSRAGYYRLSARIHYNVDFQAAEAGVVMKPMISGMNVQTVGQMGVSYHGITRRDGQWPAKWDRCDVVGVLPSQIVDLSEGAQILFGISLNGTSSHKGFLADPSYINLEWVGEKTTSTAEVDA